MSGTQQKKNKKGNVKYRQRAVMKTTPPKNNSGKNNSEKADSERLLLYESIHDFFFMFLGFQRRLFYLLRYINYSKNFLD